VIRPPVLLFLALRETEIMDNWKPAETAFTDGRLIIGYGQVDRPHFYAAFENKKNFHGRKLSDSPEVREVRKVGSMWQVNGGHMLLEKWQPMPEPPVAE
jgi:hypothetical protein